MLSIRQRLTLWYSLVLMFMLLGFGGIIFFGGTWQLRRSTDRELDLTVRALTDAVLKGGEPLMVDTAYRVLTPAGRVVRSAGLPVPSVPLTPEALNAALKGKRWRETLTIPDAPKANDGEVLDSVMPLQVRVLTVPVGPAPRFILQVGKREVDVQRLRGLMLTVLLIGLALGVPASALGGWWLAGRALAPVRAMAETAQRIEAEDLSERLPHTTQDDELGRLAVTLNGLLDRLQAAFQRERRFTADVSHDLRTPLALIKSTIGVALNRPRSVEELQSTLTTVDGQIDRVSNLLDDTLFLARADAAQISHGYAPLDLSELISDLHEIMAVHAVEEKRQTLTGTIEPGLWVRGSTDQLTRLLMNLLVNAIQYTPEGGTIHLRAYFEIGKAVVDVADTGVGMAAEDLPHIFDRFYSVDVTRSGSRKGHHGLGLSIAQAIARAHGGKITVRSVLGKGSTLTVTLPSLRQH